MANKKDLLALFELSPAEIGQILDSAQDLKKNRLGKGTPRVMDGRTGVLIFEKPSLRTRITFETAIHELGGFPINMESSSVQMGKRETVADVARNLERWVHLIVARTFQHETVQKLAKYSSVPVINALTDLYHPCQALAFGQSIYERGGKNQNLTVVFIGDGNNVAASIAVLSMKLGWNFILACPKGYEFSKEITDRLTTIGSETQARFALSHEPHDAVKDASVIYTDVWTSMGQEAEAEKRNQDFTGFTVDKSLVSRAPSDVLISHCLPAHRDEEISSDVLDSKNSIAFDEAENRLHAQKAVIVHLFS